MAHLRAPELTTKELKVVSSMVGQVKVDDVRGFFDEQVLDGVQSEMFVVWMHPLIGVVNAILSGSFLVSGVGLCKVPGGGGDEAHRRRRLPGSRRPSSR